MEVSYEICLLKDKSETKNNVYVIIDKKTKNAAIVDPGCDMKQIEQLVENKEINLNMVLITHVHEDHIRRVNDIVEKYNSNVYVSKREKEFYIYNCKNCITFEDNDEILIGETKVKCLITPGHTFGSACFLARDSIFTGDTVFIEGCGNCVSEGSSAVDLYYSIRRIREQISDIVKVYPGHTYYYRPGKEIAFLKENNIYFLIDEKEKFVQFRMRKGQNNQFNFISS